MFAYIVRRALFSVVILFFASIAIFLLVSLSGDPLTDLRQNPRIRGEDLQRLSAQYGLDQPLYRQYLIWMGDLLRGDMGISFKQQAPVNEIIGRRVVPTLLLSGTSLLITLVIAIPLGIYQAISKYSRTDNIATILAFLGFSTPVFLLGLLLQLVFGIYVAEWTGQRIFYISGISDPYSGGGFLDLVRHLVLPATTLAVISIAIFSRFQRSAMLDVLSSDYLRTARAKGLSRKSVYLKHALRNALIPTVTLLALSLGTLIAGSVITETVFAWPGLGFLFYDTLQKGDYNVARGILMILAVLIVFFNLVADLAYAVVDPRITYD